MTSSPKKRAPKPVSRARHANQCHICAHAEREQIEQDFVNWTSPLRIGEQYGVSADGIYRHARALDLIEKRRRNVRAALERIIEKAGDVDVNAAAVVSAVATYARINNRGEFVERTETVNLNALFKRMTVAELDAYAKNGTLPEWFEGVVGAAAPDGKKGPSDA